MGSGVTIRSVALIAFETLLIVAAVAVSAWIRLGPDAWSLFTLEGSLKAFLIAAVCQLCLYLGDLYDLRSIKDHRDLFVRAVRALALTSFVLAGVYYWLPTLMIGRGVFVLASFLVITTVTGWRLAFEWLSRSLGPRERLLLVGVNAAAIGLVRELFDRRHDLGVEIVGFVDADPARVGSPVLNPGVIGTIDEIPAIVRARSVDRVVVSLADARGKLPMDKLLEMRLDGVRFDHLASVYEEYTGKIAVENLRPSWLIFSTGFRKTAALLGLKRAFDLTVASVGLVLALPLMGLIAAALKLSSRGPVFYHQERVGLQGRIFTVHKFRSMRPDAEAVNRRGLGEQGRRRSGHTGWRIPQAGPPRRAPATLERSERRYEHGGSAARTPGVHPAAEQRHSVLRPATCRAARDHRLGASQVHLRRQRRRRLREASVRPLLRQEHVDRAGFVHPVFDDQDRSSEPRGLA